MSNQTACHCGCGFDEPHPLVKKVFDWCCKNSYKVSSVCRCFVHNKASGGTKNSQHLCGRAIDIRHKINDKVLAAFLKSVKPSFGLHYTWGTHVDFRYRK